MVKYYRKCFHLIFEILEECMLGFLMGTITFHVIPLAIAMSGVLTSFFGTLIGTSVFACFRKKFVIQKFLWIVLCIASLIFQRIFSFSFQSYFTNGLFLGVCAGIILSIQIVHLSLENKDNFSQINFWIWYLSGLVLGILLK